MKFIIREADKDDLSAIMEIMNHTAQGGTPEEWYVTDTEEEVRLALEQKGIVLVAEAADTKMSNTIAGFFIAKYPEQEENLGTFLAYSEKQLEQVILMESAAVAPQYQGNGLQGRMLEELEQRIDWKKYRYAMCTVHPENQYSLSNMQKHGYEIKKTVTCYGNHIRHILVKEFL